MHTDARQWVANFATDRNLKVIEVGSLNVNGTIRNLFPNAQWIGIDRVAGPCVDVVIDAELYEPEAPADAIICCEVLEHANNWRRLVDVASQWLKPGGVLIVTCAGLGRQPHSCDGGQLSDGEHYANIDPSDLRSQLTAAGFAWQYVRQYQTDVQAFAFR